MRTLLENNKLVRVKNAVAAGFGDTIAGTGVDMRGYRRVTFICALGAIADTGTAVLKAQQSSDDGSTDGYSDLEGTALAAADTDDDNKLLALEIVDPQKRYVRPAVARATANVVIDSIVAILSDPFPTLPLSQNDATVAAAEIHHSPAEGTA